MGLCPKPRWRSLQRSPDPLAVFKGPTSKGRSRQRGKGTGGGGIFRTNVKLLPTRLLLLLLMIMILLNLTACNLVTVPFRPKISIEH